MAAAGLFRTVMLRQIVTLLALIAGLTALPAQAETRASAAHGGQVEVSAGEIALVRHCTASGSGKRSANALAAREAVPALWPQTAGLFGGAVCIGVDRARE